MASASPVGSCAAIDFTAGEMTLLCALIAPADISLSRQFLPRNRLLQAGQRSQGTLIAAPAIPTGRQATA